MVDIKTRSTAYVLLGVVIVCVASASAFAFPISPIERAADYLVAGQLPGGGWPVEPAFAGECVIGLSRAYVLTGDGAYKTAAESGGSYSLDYAGYNQFTGKFVYGLYAAQAYAMSRLSQIQANPSSNSWRTALVDNLNALDAASAISAYRSNADDSSAVYDVARWTVAAYAVGHPSLATWRDGLLTVLGDIDDGDAAPTMALGAALWGLASTGDISTDTREIWAGQATQVNELADVVANLQAPDGSFYTKFDPALGYGFTETTVMATLGLKTADPILYNSRSQIASAIVMLEEGVAPSGDVYWQIGSPTSGSHGFLDGLTLELMPKPGPGDTNSDRVVDAADYIALKRNIGKFYDASLGQGDLDLDDDVDWDDLQILRSNFGNVIVLAPETIPEPATLGLLALGVLPLIRRMKKKRAVLAPVMLPVLACAMWMSMASPVSARPPSLFTLGSLEAQDALFFDPFKLITLRTVREQAGRSSGLPVRAPEPMAMSSVPPAESSMAATTVDLPYVPPIRIPYRPPLRSPMLPPQP